MKEWIIVWQYEEGYVTPGQFNRRMRSKVRAPSAYAAKRKLKNVKGEITIYSCKPCIPSSTS